MRNQTFRTTSLRSANGPSLVPTDRRRRSRLRELCDEVLASYRLATEQDLFSDSDRMEGRALLSRLGASPRA